MKKKYFISVWPVLFLTVTALCQHPEFSFSTDMGLQRSLKKDQQFWAVGQTVHVHLHVSPKEGAYFWVSYYSAGRFTNKLAATAKLTVTTPQQVNYLNNAEMRFKQISIGEKHYIKGRYDSEDSWNLYAYAGFGLLLGSVLNTHSIPIDTVIYNVPVRNGKTNFKRLTLDLGLGWEVNIGGAIYFYNEGRLWIPTTDYPSDYIFVNRNAPLVASVNFGIRVLFD